MKELYIVVYNRYNPYITYPQNANKRIGSKVFKDRDEAKAFADTVNVDCVLNAIGQTITL